MFKLFFDVVNDSVKDYGGIEFNSDGSMKIPEPKFDEQGNFVSEKKAEKKEEKTDEKVETTEANEETTEENTQESAEETTEEVAVETDAETTEAEESTEEPSTLEKRLKDTQTAYHEGQQKIKALEERLTKLETPPAKDSNELTLANIDPKVLQESMEKDRVMTTRWIVDQQMKLSLAQGIEAAKAAEAVKAKETRMEASEVEATKRFPILDKVLKMEDAQLADFKVKSPEQFEFVTKTMEYQKQFEERGDEEALYNAAARAYAELSPKTLDKIKADITRAVTKAQNNKQNTVKQAAVSTGSGTKPNKQAKKPSASEFFKLSPQEQTDAMYADFEAKLANLNKK